MPEAAAISLGRDFARALDPVILARDCGINPDPGASENTYVEREAPITELLAAMGQEHDGRVDCFACGSIRCAGDDCIDLAESAAVDRAV
jgi:hypothetical protein